MNLQKTFSCVFMPLGIKKTELGLSGHGTVQVKAAQGPVHFMMLPKCRYPSKKKVTFKSVTNLEPIKVQMKK